MDVGRVHIGMPALVAPPRTAGEDAHTASGADRSTVARAASYAGIGFGLSQNAAEVARLMRKYPEALRAAHFDPTLGRLGRLPTALGLTALTRADSRIIDPKAPPVASAASLGKSFTRFDELAMKTSVMLGASLAGVQIVASAFNLHDAISRDGDWRHDLLATTSGRAGVLQLGGGLFGVGLFAVALRQTATVGAPGVVNRLVAAGRAPVMAIPNVGRIATGSAVLALANELGFFGFLDRGERRGAVEVLRDTSRKTPVLNDPLLRTGAILGLGGMVAYKASQPMRAASLAGRSVVAGIKPLHAGFGALAAGLLGAQLLGGLRSMDRPAGR